MKVQLSVDELREVLRCEHTRVNGKCTVSRERLDAYMEAMMDEVTGIAPEEQIRFNPSLALDAPEPSSSQEQKIAELLRWFHRPEDARGTTVYVPHGHPCGLGGQNVYIPESAAPRPCL